MAQPDEQQTKYNNLLKNLTVFSALTFILSSFFLPSLFDSWLFMPLLIVSTSLLVLSIVLVLIALIRQTNQHNRDLKASLPPDAIIRRRQLQMVSGLFAWLSLKYLIISTKVFLSLLAIFGLSLTGWFALPLLLAAFLLSRVRPDFRFCKPLGILAIVTGVLEIMIAIYWFSNEAVLMRRDATLFALFALEAGLIMWSGVWALHIDTEKIIIKPLKR